MPLGADYIGEPVADSAVAGVLYEDARYWRS
jgi:hypothetical protein